MMLSVKYSYWTQIVYVLKRDRYRRTYAIIWYGPGFHNGETLDMLTDYNVVKHKYNILGQSRGYRRGD